MWQWRWACLYLSALPCLGCSADAPALYAEPWPEANQLFLDDARWIGGDGAYSVDWGGGRVLWLFGDSFIALSPERVRRRSYMVRNSIGIQTGLEPTRAFMSFYYRMHEGNPQSFVPEQGKEWFWPGHGIRVGDRALLFYGRVFQEGEGMWGFAVGDSAAFTVDNPEEDPLNWNLQPARFEPAAERMQLGGAVLREGDDLYVYGTEGSPRELYLLKFQLAAALAGDLSAPLFWTGDGWGKAADRESIMDFVAPEFSIHYAEPLGLYVYTETAGFGATTIAIRTAPRMHGPWTGPRDLLRPPESARPDAFVYAGKAHPELAGGDSIVTYVPSSQHPLPEALGEPLYYPRFARITYR